MKSIVLILTIILTVSLSGCVTYSSSDGKNFASENVSKVVKGKTTSEEMVQLFGQPSTKTVLTASGEKWIYTYSAEAQSYIAAIDVKNTRTQKRLDVLIRNGVVENFTFTDE
jgi:outer membrane protein assembly factor BamE (lipoprotein component of BamABCDE complex)